MRKFLPYIIILVCVVGLFSPVGRVGAQATAGICTYTALNGERVIETSISRDDCKNPSKYKDGDWKENTTVGIPAATTGSTPSPSQPCSIFSAGTYGVCLIDYILAPLAYLLLGLAALILYVAGTILNLVLDYTIVNMAKNIAGLTGINIAWKVLRDLMNIAFIFLLVYEAILMIIGQSDVAKIRKFIIGIVLASLLINFSLFFTKVLIDASNIVTIGLYNSIIDTSNSPTTSVAVPTSGSTGAGTARSVVGLSVPFMNSFGLTGIYSGASFDDTRKNVGGSTNMLIFFIMGTVIFIIVSFVFFAVAVMFLIRYVTLIILLMLSPIAYMGLAGLPGMKTYTDDWWKALNSQLLFAPIYMLMTWVILTLLQSGGFTSSGNWGGVTSGNIESISLIFNFAVIIALIIASLVIAKSTSTKGSSFIKDATGKLTTFAGGAVMGGAAATFRGTVGRAGQAVANNQWLKERAPESRLARMALSAGTKTGAASLDVRGAGFAKDMGMGKAGGKGGFQQAREDKIKRRMQFAEKNMPDTVTGADVEREMAITNDAAGMSYSKANNEIRVQRLITAGRSRADATAAVAAEVETVRRTRQVVLTRQAEANTERRRERYIHNLSQTRWNTPLYRGVYDNTDAARRMRSGQTSTNARDTLLRAIADYQAANPTTPPVVPPVVPPTP